MHKSRNGWRPRPRHCALLLIGLLCLDMIAPRAAAQSVTDAPPLAEATASTLAGDAFGDGEGGLNTGILSLRFLLQTRMARTLGITTTAESAVTRAADLALAHNGDGLSLQRFFVGLSLHPFQYARLKTIVDLAEFVHGNPKNAVKQAFVTLNAMNKHIELTLGLFKLPFSVLELDPIAAYPFASLGAADDLIKRLNFAGRDVGIELAIAPLHRTKALRLAFGAFRGPAYDESSAVVGSIGARIEARPLKGFRLGVGWVEHPQTIVYLRPLDTSHKDLLALPADEHFPRAQTFGRGRALGADIRYQAHRLRVQVEGMFGARTDIDTRYGAQNFIAGWGLAGYTFHFGPIRVLPFVRVGWLDADADRPGGRRRELSGALNIDIAKNIRVMLDVTRTDVEPNSPRLDQPKPIPLAPFIDLSSTRLVGQIQVIF